MEREKQREAQHEQARRQKNLAVSDLPNPCSLLLLSMKSFVIGDVSFYDYSLWSFA